MWKKEDTMATPTPTPVPATPAEPLPRTERPAPAVALSGSSDRATIGRSIAIRGDVTGDEDLLIQGRVEGSVDLKQHAITIGAEGDVQASVVGRVVIVEGRVQGNISSDEQVILRSSARVQGDITAPRVVLEDGARFRGGIDMGDISEPGRSGTSAGQSKRPGSGSNAASTSSEASADNGKTTADSQTDRTKGGSGAVAEVRA